MNIFKSLSRNGLESSPSYGTIKYVTSDMVMSEANFSTYPATFRLSKDHLIKSSDTIKMDHLNDRYVFLNINKSDCVIEVHYESHQHGDRNSLFKFIIFSDLQGRIKTLQGEELTLTMLSYNSPTVLDFIGYDYEINNMVFLSHNSPNITITTEYVHDKAFLHNGDLILPLGNQLFKLNFTQWNYFQFARMMFHG